MTTFLLDTHTWVWAIKLDPLLPTRIAETLVGASAIQVSAVSFYEIAQKVRLGKWSQMEPFADRLATVLAEQGGQLINMDGTIAQLAGLLDWNHRDPFDRMIAATSIHLKLPLLSADTVFDQLSHRKDWPGRIW